jgi:sodium/potassium/calcium exchanger 6
MAAKKWITAVIAFAVLAIVLTTYQSTKQSAVKNGKKFPFLQEVSDDTKHEHICWRVSHYEEDRCVFARKHCEEEGLIPYIVVRYCYFFKFVPWFFYILCLIWLLFLFYLMSNTADAYFTPCLEQLSKFFRLSPDVAGVTFLALGNGAPDIFSIFAGILSGSSGLGIGQPIGSSLFIISFVLAAVILLSKEVISVNPFYFLRDIIVLIIAIIFVFICSHFGELTVVHGIMFFVIYFLYVGVVLIGNVVSKFDWKRIMQRYAPRSFLPADYLVNETQETEEEHGIYYEKDPSLKIKRVSEEDTQEDRATEPLIDGETTPNGIHLIDDHFPDALEEIEESKSLWARSWDLLLESLHWEDRSPFRKFTFFFEAPSILVRNLTIPSADPEDWSKFYAVVSPIFIPGFMLFCLERALDIPMIMHMIGGKFPLILLLTLIGMVFSAIIFFTSAIGKAPRYHFIFVFFCFVTSVCWFFLIAEELVSLMKALGTAWGISEAILALTVLAFGFSVGDLVTDIAIARSGHAQMAVSAIFASPTLNVLISLG